MIASTTTARQLDRSPLAARRGLLILLLLCGAQFLAVLDATIVNVALPSIQRALHFTPQNLQWVASGYALTFAGFLLLGGRAADRLGRRLVFMTGVLLFIAASLASGLATSLVYGLTRAPDVGWANARTIAEFAGAAALLAVFIANEARSGTALLPLRTFGLPGIASANAAALLQFSAVIPVFFFLTLYLQQVLGYSALRSGLAFLPLAAGVIAIAPAAARLVSRFGPAPTLIAGPLVFAGGLVYLSRLPVHGAYLSDILPGLAMVAVGAGLGFVSIINAATGGVPRTNAGVAAGLVNTMQRVGSAVGLAVLTAVATARTRALAAPGHQVIAVVAGYDRAFAIAAGFAAAASLLSLAAARTRRRISAASPDNQAPAARVPVADAA
jgi:predicted MFS family arabinose efflux permease